MLKSETLAQGGGKRRNRDGGTGRKPGIKTSGGSMKSPNLVLRLKLDHNVSANCGKKQLAVKNNVYQLCVRLQWPIVWTQKAFLKKKEKKKGQPSNQDLDFSGCFVVGGCFGWSCNQTL